MELPVDKIKKGLLNPQSALRYGFNKSHRNAATYMFSHYDIGTNVFELDWDCLILLDTCRLDALRTVAENYGFLSNIDSIISVGGQSGEWMVNTFNHSWKDEISDTAYISANPHTESVIVDRMDPDSPHHDKQIGRLARWGRNDFVDQSAFGLFEQVWKHDSNDEERVFDRSYEHSPPRYVTDRGIAVSRERDFDRLILHYMIPHAPYISEAITQGRDLNEHERNPFEYIRRTGSRTAVFDAYLSDLRYVLDEVELLRENIDCDTLAVSSDHGEAFGEFGVYMHHVGSLHHYVRRVPWMTTSCRDEETYEPELSLSESDERSAEDVLESLGYLA